MGLGDCNQFYSNLHAPSCVVRKAAVWLLVGVFVYSETVMLFYANMVKLS